MFEKLIKSIRVRNCAASLQFIYLIYFSEHYCMLTFVVLSSKEQNIQYPIQYQHCQPGNKVSQNETCLTNIAFICAVWRRREEL